MEQPSNEPPVQPAALPVVPPPGPTDPAVPQQDTAQETQRIMGEVVGFWPNWKKSDNAFQAIGILIAIVIGALIMLIWNPTGMWWLSALIGVLAGLILGALVTGFILMIKGLKGQINK